MMKRIITVLFILLALFYDYTKSMLIYRPYLPSMGDSTGEQELNFLPLISDLLKSVEKESGDVNQKMTELKNKLDKAKEFVEKMPGIQHSQSEQIKQIDILRNQLTMKTALLEKYKGMEKFDLSS